MAENKGKNTRNMGGNEKQKQVKAKRDEKAERGNKGGKRGVDMDKRVHRSTPPNPGPDTNPALDPAAEFGAANPDDLTRDSEPLSEAEDEPASAAVRPASPDTWDYQADPQVEEVIQETQDEAAVTTRQRRDVRVHNAESPILSGGDVEADWERGVDVGEETVGGTVATPDQDRVDELGQAVGLEYQDNEPLHTEDKLEKRDRNRWELDIASKNEMAQAEEIDTLAEPEAEEKRL